jgi:hypothetical protein
MAKSETGHQKLRGLALEQEVMKLRLAGATFQQIARNLGCSVGGAHKACMRAIKRVVEEINEDTEAVLHLELQRLDAMLLGIYPKAAAGDFGAIDRALRIMERRAKYLGLDAPQRWEHTGREGGPIRHEYDFSHLSDEELEREYQRAREEAASIRAGTPAESEAG